ncbi:MAG TPA: histidine triad nucleotide-binding protein [Methylomusa anaerophila]|uniref:HIT-like protein n=1 Tax=Methylomusa anaerophila TaxID=1930071 RepID=A0A348ANY3_9FIRM|nr:histidine triad nucleotide-binding protein [Methylomusa anaerophila]BBB92781.1 HIT-like protein [Methylomusa anaerophila]HML87368.1 histidine triad nucleotide-binding protein [Methylomusa anaerophila]
MQHDCIFCKIASKEIPVKAVYEDEHMLAFPDINPVAPVHLLVIPKRHISNLLEVHSSDGELLAHIMTTIPKIATEAGLSEEGFRLVINTKRHGGQTVDHLHWHVLGGRHMEWPPG